MFFLWVSPWRWRVCSLEKELAIAPRSWRWSQQAGVCLTWRDVAVCKFWVVVVVVVQDGEEEEVLWLSDQECECYVVLWRWTQLRGEVLRRRWDVGICSVWGGIDSWVVGFLESGGGKEGGGVGKSLWSKKRVGGGMFRIQCICIRYLFVIAF